ncbi:rab-GTPase-TBC domain-containing protein [Amanita rubescens]|nr:rab-GTPase-TBC domain-containing protein [Amanita rubescens]
MDPPPPLNLTDFDDAFSDGEADTAFHFSPDALREELANFHRAPEHEETATHNFDLQEIHESLPNIHIGDTAQSLQRDSSSGSSSTHHTPQSSVSRAELENTEDASSGITSVTGSEDAIRASTDSAMSEGAVCAIADLAPPGTPAILTPKSAPLPDRRSPSSFSSLGPPDTTIKHSYSSPQQRSDPKPLERPPMHRPSRSAGPSMFEKVMSKTRPSFLPPKPKQEDRKHLADWQNMMKMSQLAAEKRRKALQERRLLREKAIEESLNVWKRDIVPDWRVVHKDPALRKLWWRGIPTKLRADMWECAVGNPLSLRKDHYRACLSRAKRALSSGIFPEATLSRIEEDISSTLPSIHIFNRDSGPLYADLKDMLCAWVISRSDEGLDYTTGAAKIAAMMLINMPAPQGFNVMKNLLERHCMRSFYGGDATRDDVEAYYRIFDTLLADGMPKIFFNFKQHHVSPAAYLPDWLLPLFLNHLPFEACARVWDVVILEGDSFLYRAALAILAVLEPRLFFPERKELLELLKGENRAALVVAQREKRPLDGGKYEIYGLDEETLWERIESMNDWWRESTWTRLIQRELPDV